MVEGYISLAEARASQVGQVEAALPNIAAQVQAAGFGGPGPIFLGIGASSRRQQAPRCGRCAPAASKHRV